MNKVFPFLYGFARGHSDVDFVTGLRTELQKRRYPRDEEFRESLINDPLYGSGERITRTRFLLESLERSYGHKEVVNLEGCSIEHVLPQSDEPTWRQHLGKAYDDVKETWLHTLGNLTLSAYNREMSNKPFAFKQEELRKSNLQLNKSLALYSDWNEQTIQERAQYLAEQALTIWPDFRPTKTSLQDMEIDITGSKPYEVSILDTTYPVKSWVDVMRQTVGVIIDLAPDKMEALRDTFPNWLSDTPSFKRNDPLPNGMYLFRSSNTKSIYRHCRKMLDFIEIGADDWRVNVE